MVWGYNGMGIYNTNITAGGGNIIVFGSSYGSSASRGIFLSPANFTTNSTGNINMLGECTGTGSNALTYGIQMASSSIIATNGNISIVGNASLSSSIFGLVIESGAPINLIQTTAGNITIKATTIGGWAEYALSNTTINSTAGGTISFLDNPAWSGNIATFAVNSPTGTINIFPTTGNTLTVGANVSTTAMLGIMNAANFIFGASNSGNITVNSSYNFGSSNVTVLSGNNITLAANLNKTSGLSTTNYIFAAANQFVNSNAIGVNATSGGMNLAITAANVLITNGTFNAINNTGANITLTTNAFTTNI
jgi:hypothetical protein